MTATGIIVQLLGVVSFILAVVGTQQSKKHNYLYIDGVYQIVFIIQYTLVGKYGGIIAFSVGFVRAFVFAYYAHKKKKPQPALLFLFIFIIVSLNIRSWQGLLTLVPLIVTPLNTWGTWQDNMRIARLTLLIAACSWIGYDLVSGMYTGAMTELVKVVSVVIAIYRYDVRGVRD